MSGDFVRRSSIRTPHRIFWILVREERWAVFGLMGLALLSVVGTLLAPVFQKFFFDHIASAETLKWALAFFVAFAVSRALEYLLNLRAQALSCRAQSRAAKMLYAKAMRLKGHDLGGTGTGEIVTLYATDVPGMAANFEMNIPQAFSVLFSLLLAPVSLNFLFDFPLLPLMLTQLVVVAVIVVFALRQARLFARFKRLAGERLNIINEWIQNIRTLRFMSWVEPFEEKILTKREEETLNRVSMVSNGQVLATIGNSVGFVFNVVAIVSFVNFIDRSHVQPLQASDLFVILWILAITLGRAYRGLPWILTFYVDAMTSAKRLDAFLNLPESQASFLDPDNASAESTTSTNLLSVRGCYLSYEDKSILHNLSFDIARGEFVAIVGEVGSGKSSLFQSLLLESPAHFASYTIDGRGAQDLGDEQIKKHFAFVPQDLFVASATIRDNVWLGYGSALEFDPHIQRSLQRSQLDLEHEGFASQGLNTTLGERGVNLSGGQRQRLMLARADFFDRPIVLFDDAMSAVDESTEKRLLHELCDGAWSQKTRILATHRLTILPHVDRILFLKEGQLVAEGSFEQLQNECSDFVRFVAQIKRPEQSAQELRP